MKTMSRSVSCVLGLVYLNELFVFIFYRQAGIGADTAAADTATTGAEEACDVEVADSITLDPKNLRMSKEERNRIRNSLRSSIQDLKEKEVMEKLTASDPLLG